MKKIVALLLSFLTLNSIAGTDPKEAYELMKKNEAVIVDVREENEIKAGMIKDAKWFPLSKISEDKNWKEDFKKLTEDKKIFLYCRSGNRSGKVLNILKEIGIKSENLGGYETLKHELPIKE